MDREVIDLYNLQTRLKSAVEQICPSKVWLRAEISAFKPRQGGHCYLELSQSGDAGLIAKAQAIIWASKYRLLAPYFQSVTGSPLQTGISVLVQVQVGYSQLYGLSLIIDDIDPEFTLGEKEALRRRTIARLQTEGLLEAQKRLDSPVLPRSLAVISAEGAAGYGDFMRHLTENPYGFTFSVTLFPALMQGSSCPESIISAMEDITLSDRHFDMVLILRGGGSELDLACYDDYDLCAGIARFPLPVYTAIGHDRDYHIADMVAYEHVKTPTALADMIVDWIADEDGRLLNFITRFKLAFSARISAAQSRLDALQTHIRSGMTAKIAAAQSRLDVIEARTKAADPRNILKKGYVLALDASGAVLKGVEGRSQGDNVSLMFSDGILKCTVDKVEPLKNQ